MKCPLLEDLRNNFKQNYYAYKNNRYFDYILSILNHELLQHLETKDSYTRILFIDFREAFTTISPSILRDKMIKIGIKPQLCNWTHSFPSQRLQRVRIGSLFSDWINTNNFSPQRSPISDFLFSVFTSDCGSYIISDDSKEPICSFWKYADDFTLLDLLCGDGIEADRYRKAIKRKAKME